MNVLFVKTKTSARPCPDDQLIMGGYSSNKDFFSGIRGRMEFGEQNFFFLGDILLILGGFGENKRG